MTTVPVRVGGEIVISISALSTEALEQLKAALTFPNEDREKKAREKVFGWWDEPETITLWRIEKRRGGDEVICLPRGFASHLAAGIQNMGLEIVWDDQRSLVPAQEGYFKPFTLRDYQLDACMRLLHAQQGFYKGPTGSGKTETALGTMAYANQRTLVVVDKAYLVEQWRLRAARRYDMPILVDDDGHELASLEGERSVGKIGEDVWEERDLTIALRQTLHARRWQADATKWWATWGATWFDEGHHLAAETVTEIARQCTSFYLHGTSATNAPTPTRGNIVHALVGPIVAETPKEILYERGILVRPRVQIIDTDFEADFWDTHDSWNGTDGEGHATVCCNVPGCPKSRQGKKHQHRNNYSSVLKKLVESKTRNALIAKIICEQRGHIHLVGSRQLKHLDAIRDQCIEAGWPKERMWYLRGEENARGESQKIVQAIQASHEGIVFSTVADEALDIPPIDRVWSTFPIRAEHLVIQYTGRGERSYPGKKECAVMEVHDPGCTVFNEQHDERLRVYRMQGYQIANYDPEAAPAPGDVLEVAGEARELVSGRVIITERADDATESRISTGHRVADDDLEGEVMLG